MQHSKVYLENGGTWYVGNTIEVPAASLSSGLKEVAWLFFPLIRKKKKGEKILF